MIKLPNNRFDIPAEAGVSNQVTILLRFASPLQSWGYENGFETKLTAKEPTKSGVIGMVAAALGRKREDPIDDLVNEIDFGCRIDRAGTLLNDFQTMSWKYQNEEKASITMQKYYIQDGVFVVGLHLTNMDLAKKICDAFKAPKFPLYLGRKCCIPTQPIFLWVSPLSLLEALKSVPWCVSDYVAEKTDSDEVKLQIIINAGPDDKVFLRQNDNPISFNQNKRSYYSRRYTDKYFAIVKNDLYKDKDLSSSSESIDYFEEVKDE